MLAQSSAQAEQMLLSLLKQHPASVGGAEVGKLRGGEHD